VNFFLTRYIVNAAPGSAERMAQIGKLHFWVWPVIVVPSMLVMMWTLIRLVKGIEELTGLKMDEMFHPN
jgi:uncharacterized protein (DUF983 family)